MKTELTLTPLVRALTGKVLNKGDTRFTEVAEPLVNMLRKVKDLGFAAEGQCFLYESNGCFGWLEKTTRSYHFTGMLNLIELSILMMLLKHKVLTRTTEKVAPKDSAPGTLVRLRADVPAQVGLQNTPDEAHSIARFLYNEWRARRVMHLDVRCSLLGFQGADWYYLPAGLYFDNKRPKNTTPVRQQTIKAMKTLGLLQLDETAKETSYHLNRNLATGSHKAHGAVNVRSFMAEYVRMLAYKNVEGLCFHTPNRQNWQHNKLPYAWLCNGHRGLRCDDVQAWDVPTIEYLLKCGVLVRGETEHTPNGNVLARLHFAPGFAPARPAYVQNFLDTWRKNKSAPGFRGLVHQDWAGETREPQPYKWAWYNGSDGCDFINLSPSQAKAVQYLFDDGTLSFDATTASLPHNGSHQFITGIQCHNGMMD